MENNSKSLLELASYIGLVLSEITFTRAQNETIIQNQVLINSKLMDIMDHFDIKIKPEPSQADTDLLKECIETIYSEFYRRAGTIPDRLKALKDSMPDPVKEGYDSIGKP